MACSLWVLLLASCFSSGQQLGSVIRLQPFSQSRRDTFGLCKLYANQRAAACCETPHSSVRSGCSGNKLNVVTTTQTHPHASGRVFVLFMVWLHHHEQQQLSPLSLMQSELKSCYYLDFSSFIFFVKHENSTKCANKSPEITRTGTECRVGCEHANSGSFFLFDAVHMKVSGWKHLSAFVCVGGVASPC